MTNQELVGKAMIARCNLDLPTKHKVAPGQTFRYLQAHCDGGASAVMWLACGQVELAGDNARLSIPAEPVGTAGRRRSRFALAEAPVIEVEAEADAPAEDAAPSAEGGE